MGQQHSTDNNAVGERDDSVTAIADGDISVDLSVAVTYEQARTAIEQLSERADALLGRLERLRVAMDADCVRCAERRRVVELLEARFQPAERPAK